MKPYFLSKRFGHSGSWRTYAQIGQYTSHIMLKCTISPSTGIYDDLSPDDQIQLIKTTLTDAVKTCNKYKERVVIREGSFEFNKRGQIHYHGLLLVSPESSPEFYAIKLGKFIHKQLGRKGLPWYICCTIDANDNLNGWLKYINKEKHSTKWMGTTPTLLDSLLMYINTPKAACN